MPTSRIIRRTAPLLILGALTFGVGACGSSDDSGDSKTDTTTTEVKTGTTTGDVTPGKKAPASAGDRKNAPDSSISDRPGGPAKPATP